MSTPERPREYVDCPRAKSSMTPCIARDGSVALDDPHAMTPACVGCGALPRPLLLDLSERYKPARRHRQTHDPRSCADLLQRFVREYVDAGDSSGSVPEPEPREWTILICRTCSALAVYPFCEHRNQERADPTNGVMEPWFESVVVVGKAET